VKVNCLNCGHVLDLHDAYDDYDGPVRCFVCRTLLAVRTREGQVKWVEIAGSLPPVGDSSLQRTP
jgi:hypothetical protein